LNRLVVKQMAGMPFEEMVAKLEANQNQTRLFNILIAAVSSLVYIVIIFDF
jgi:hypothetical protein